MDALASIGLKEAQLVFHAFLKAVKHRGSCPVLPTYVYCSGHYVMAAGLEWTDERQPALAPCNKGSAWRRDIEDEVLTSSLVNGVVIRPVCLYGKGGSYFGAYHFRPALEALKKGKKRFQSIVGESSKIATVHCDDAAELFVAVAERVSPANQKDLKLTSAGSCVSRTGVRCVEPVDGQCQRHSRRSSEDHRVGRLGRAEAKGRYVFFQAGERS